jgi:5-methylcytosine-specific restriction endonuclease McrA
VQPAHYQSGKFNYREIAFRYYPKKCNRCAYDNERILVVHHIDRNRDNNHSSNLEILCPNCHEEEHLQN